MAARATESGCVLSKVPRFLIFLLPLMAPALKVDRIETPTGENPAVFQEPKPMP